MKSMAWGLVLVLLVSFGLVSMGSTDTVRASGTTDPPAVSSISPTFGPQGQATTVVITGTGFTSESTVTVDGTAVTSTLVDPDSLSVEVPGIFAPGALSVVVTDTAPSEPSVFTVIGAPTVTEISPGSGPLAGGTEITVTGTGFKFGDTSFVTEVTVGGVAATGVTVISEEELTATVPEGAEAGVAPMVVTVDVGGTEFESSQDVGFEYLAPEPLISLFSAPGPDVDSISPSAGSAAGGMSIEIVGSGFGGSVSAVAVKIGDAVANVIRVTDTKIIAVAPENQPSGSKNVTVTVDGVGSTILPDAFSFIDGSFGDFRVQDFATGTGNGNFLFRGYVFKPAREIRVTGIWGGSGRSCTGFEAFIADAVVDPATIKPEETTNTPSIKLGAILSAGGRTARVDWRLLQNDTPEYQDFEEPFSLFPNQYYFIGQQRDGSGSGCHFNTTSLDFENLILGSAIIDEWYPRDNSQYRPSGFNMSSFSNTTDTIRILVGFRYETPTVLATFKDTETSAVRQSDTSVLVSAELLSTGESELNPDGQTTLYFEIATNAAFTTGVSLLPASPPDIRGPAANIPVARTISGLSPSTEYHFRPVAINEAGRVNGETKTFTINDLSTGFDVTTARVNEGDATGSVTPELRTVLEGNSTTFVATPGSGSSVSAMTTCAGGVTRSGNTFTVSNVTAACAVTFTFVEGATQPPPPPPPPAPAPAATPRPPAVVPVPVAPPVAPQAAVVLRPRVVEPGPLQPGPVLRNNVAPTPPAAPTAIVGGTPTTVQSTVQSPTNLALRVDRLNLGISVQPDQGSVRQAPGGQTEVQVRSGTSATLQGTGVAPRSVVQVFMPLQGDNAKEITRIQADEAGNFNGEALFATGLRDAPIPIGRQVLQMVTVDDEGRQAVVELTVNIAQPPPAPEPDREVGITPVLLPGQSLATTAGVPTPVTVIALPDDKQTRIEGDGWTMAVDVNNPNAAVEETEDGGVLLKLVRDETAQVSGTGFMPLTRADVWLFSEPTLLGTVDIDENGEFNGEVNVDGRVVSVGEHTLQLQGVGMDGYVRAANLGVLVGDDAPEVVTTAEQAGGFFWWLLLVALAVIIGIVVFFAWLRRKGEQEA